MTAPVDKFGIREPRQQRSRETARRIEGALLELLATKDYEAITISDLCIAADVSSSSFYARYRNKDAALAAAFDSYRESADALIEELLHLLAEESDLNASLRIVMQTYVGFLVRQEPLRRAFMSVPELQRRHESIDSHVTDGAGVLAKALLSASSPDLELRLEFLARATGTILQKVVLGGPLPWKLGVSEDVVIEMVCDLVEVYVVELAARADRSTG